MNPDLYKNVRTSNYEVAYYNPDETRKWFEKAKALWASLIKEYNIPAE